jgi:hypothetical protein
MDENTELDGIKRACMMCSTYKNFNPERSEESRRKVLGALNQMANQYRDRFDDLRREESTSEQDVETARLNKIVCLDAFDLCKACDKDEDKVKQFIRKLK